MPLKVLVIPDKFKGTLGAEAAAQAIARGWHRSRPRDRLELLPMSDGGDGFGEVMGKLRNAKVQRVTTVDAAHQRCIVPWWWEPKTRAAIIEWARGVGLAMLPVGQFHPFALDTFGLGALLLAAQSKGARKCLVGIGGSATNDGGFGLARAMGWQFLDGAGDVIERWPELGRLERICFPGTALRSGKVLRKHAMPPYSIEVAVDVQNPL